MADGCASAFVNYALEHAGNNICGRFADNRLCFRPIFLDGEPAAVTDRCYEQGFYSYSAVGKGAECRGHIDKRHFHRTERKRINRQEFFPDAHQVCISGNEFRSDSGDKPYRYEIAGKGQCAAQCYRAEEFVVVIARPVERLALDL